MRQLDLFSAAEKPQTPKAEPSKTEPEAPKAIPKPKGAPQPQPAGPQTPNAENKAQPASPQSQNAESKAPGPRSAPPSSPKKATPAPQTPSDAGRLPPSDALKTADLIADPVWSLFDPLIARWFTTQVGPMTQVQAQAWPVIAGGQNALITAPTGSGKTLSAFLFALNQLLTGVWEGGKTRVLYISPLKALNQDIARNLETPLAQIEALAEREQRAFSPVHIAVRSGDSTEEERRRMARNPPEILVTTPESLNLMLSSKRGLEGLRNLKTVILDEIHDVAGNKRGAFLMLGVERLTRLSGEFQRIALSATVQPLNQMARFVGGALFEGEQRVPRPVTLVRAQMPKQFTLTVQGVPEEPDPNGVSREEAHLKRLAKQILAIILKHRSTLIFANSRRRAEKIARFCNEAYAEKQKDESAAPIAFAHHGSLSKELRRALEDRLKRGEIRAIVATKSLELGIDIGALDQVVLLDAPPDVASGVQRMGRAGHQVGEQSRAVLFASYPHALVDAAILGPMIEQQQIEPLQIPRSPLDVLAQALCSLCLYEIWQADKLFSFLRQCESYADLSRDRFDGLLDMLSGRYAQTRIRELEPRLRFDRLTGLLQTRESVRMLLYSSGGVIADRGYYRLRLSGSQSILGELDEEFVWERKPGEIFSFGTRSWCIEEITQSEVVVTPAQGRGIVVFFKGDMLDRSFALMERYACTLEQWEIQLKQKRPLDLPGLDAESKRQLCDHLKAQRDATGQLPHRHCVIVERFEDPDARDDQQRIAIHAPFGGQVLRPLSIALCAVFQAQYSMSLDVTCSNEAIGLTLPPEIDLKALFSLLMSRRIEDWLRLSLESTGYFGARFRECAQSALLLPRPQMKKRMPLWLNRLRSQKLKAAISQLTDFPILIEAWRSCLEDSFDLSHLKSLLCEVEDGEIAVVEARTAGPSPFIADLIWQSTNDYMYRDDSARNPVPSRLDQTLIFRPEDRPRIPQTLSKDLEDRLQRKWPAFLPEDLDDLRDLLAERLVMPADEWALACQTVGGSVDAVQIQDLIAMPDLRSQVEAALRGVEPDWLLGELLRSYAVITEETLLQKSGLKPEDFSEALETLFEQGRIVRGHLSEDSEAPEVCDAENYDRLLRMLRRARKPQIETLPLEALPLFTAEINGLTHPQASSPEAVQDCLQRLLGIPAQAALWESEILPARIEKYDCAHLDRLQNETALCWYGTSEGKIAFGLEDALDLLRFSAVSEEDAEDALPMAPQMLLPSFTESQTASEMSEKLGLKPEETHRRIWQAVWQGRLTSDCATLRQAIKYKFAYVRRPAAPRASKSSLSSWKKRTQAESRWETLPNPLPPCDLVEEELQNKERLRLLFSRYGLLFRERLQNELPNLRWRPLIRALRSMELAGEIYCGVFFEGISGLQFVDAHGLELLKQGLKLMPEPNLQKDLRDHRPPCWWISAADPISPCGLSGFKNLLPSRLPQNHLFYAGQKLALVGHRNGSVLELRGTEEEIRTALPAFKRFAMQHRNLAGEFEIHTIQEEDAAYVPAAQLFCQIGFVRRYRMLVLRT